MRKRLMSIFMAVAIMFGLSTATASAANAAIRTPPPVAMGARCYQTWKPHWYSTVSFRIYQDVSYSKCVYYYPVTDRMYTVYKFNAGL